MLLAPVCFSAATGASAGSAVSTAEFVVYRDITVDSSTYSVKTDKSIERIQESAVQPLEKDEPDVNAAPPEKTVLLYDTDSQKVIDLPLEEYLIGVVLAEMPYTFAPEALKAQAVAARSFTLWQIGNGRHENADLCSDYHCCQAWSNPDTASERWGEALAEEALRAVRTAVESTTGEILTYNGDVACAVFHASSHGATASSREVWGGELAYLVSVASPEDAPCRTVGISCDRFVEILNRAGYSIAKEEKIQIKQLQSQETGRVESLEICGTIIPGTALRSLFSLPSTSFTVTVEEENIVFTVWGNGHGVGMSQLGADALARSGNSYAEILSHYYPGTALVPMP